MTFTQGQTVRMLIETMGVDNEDEERTHPAGTLGRIDSVENDRRIYHVEIGTGDEVIVNSFDFGAEAEAAMAAIEAPSRIVATPVNGGGIVLKDGDGAVIGQLSLTRVAGGCAAQQALRDRIITAINAGQPERRIHHLGRGADYDVVASEALFQVSNGGEVAGPQFGAEKGRIVEDGTPVTVYRNNELGMHFVRFPDEVVSPRFQEIQS